MVIVLSVKALLVSLSPDIGHLLSQEALSITMSAIVRSPVLKVRFWSARLINSFALRLM